MYAETPAVELTTCTSMWLRSAVKISRMYGRMPVAAAPAL